MYALIEHKQVASFILDPENTPEITPVIHNAPFLLIYLLFNLKLIIDSLLAISANDDNT